VGYAPPAGMTGMKGTSESTESGKSKENKRATSKQVSVFTLSFKKGVDVYRASESSPQKNNRKIRTSKIITEGG
jgi:hypothetical protein